MSSASKTKFLVLGVTGYVGAAVLERFLAHPHASTFEITALIRSPEKAEKYRSFGINTVVGSFSDLDLLEKLAEEADIVIAVANSDDLPAAQATLRGSKKRYEATGKSPIYIHTSGAAVYASLDPEFRGRKEDVAIYDDSNPDQIESLPPTAPHRNVDLVVVNADAEGYVKTYIVVPGCIYGHAQGIFYEAGLANRHTFALPPLIKFALSRGQAGVLGDGTNIWPCVEVHEVANFYITLYNAIVSEPATGHGRDGYYNLSNGEYTWYEFVEAIAKALVQLGKAKGKDTKPTLFMDEEITAYIGAMGATFFGSNVRVVANHSRAIGWSPKKTTADFLASIRAEVEALAATES